MQNKWLIDSDVLIDYLRGVAESIHFLEKEVETSAFYISAITLAEIYAGIREGKERKLFDKLLQIFEIISVDNNIAQIGGLYRRDFGKSHGVGLADALIAATVEQSNLSLLTLNKKHFPMLKNIVVPYAKQ